MASVETIKISENQSHGIIAVSQFVRIINAASVMHDNRIGCLIVVEDFDDETMVGVISERDILGWIGNASPETYAQQVRDVMTRNVISCQPGGSASNALDLMKKHHIRHMPIVEKGRAVGMLSVRDLLERHLNTNSDRI
jgi:CBS domain-containing protein